MRRASILIVVALLAASMLAGCETAADSPVDVEGPGDVTVTMAGSAFQPGTVTIASGQTVTWSNNDSLVHTVTGDGFSSGDVAPGAIFTNTFDAPGVYPYECTIHPGMTGSVVVE